MPQSGSPTFDVLLFEHIPKTAGTTFWHVLGRRYGRPRGEGLFLFHNMNLARDKPQAQFDDLAARITSGHPPRTIISHVGYGLHERLPGDLQYAHVTLLRDPIERTISYYYYEMQHGRVPEGTSLATFCAPDPSSPYFLKAYNMQTAFLSGRRAAHILDGRTPGLEEYSEEMLEEAKVNLDRLDTIGFLERFDESILLAAATFGWPLRSLRFVPRNRGKRRPQQLALTAEDRAALEAANRFDAVLYDYASARFEALLAERVPDAEGRLRALGRINKLYAPVAPLERRLLDFRSRLHARLSKAN